MKASEAKKLVRLYSLQKTVLPDIYQKIEANAKNGLTSLNIGKPGQEVLDVLKDLGYRVEHKDDGDPHSSHILSYTIWWN